MQAQVTTDDKSSKDARNQCSLSAHFSVFKLATSSPVLSKLEEILIRCIIRDLINYVFKHSSRVPAKQ